MKGYKVRLGDGSEIGPMDLQAVHSWYAQGLLETTSPVLAPGAKHWQPLSEAIEIVDLRSPRRAGGRPVATGTGARSVSYVWPMRVAGALAFLGAAGAGFFWWYPRRFTPALDPAPWREIGLALVAAGLLLVRGWGWGRRLVQALSLLSAGALPVLAGILVVEGVRGRPLLAMLAAFVFAGGLFALLSVWPNRWYKPASAGLLTVAGLAGVGHFGMVQETPLQRRVHESIAPERSFNKDGVSVELPESWRLLRPGQTAAAVPEEAKAVLGELRLGGLAYIVAEDAPRGVATLEQYFERTLARRRQEAPGLTELGRREVRAGRLPGLALDGSWNAAGGRFRDLTAAWRNGGTYVALVAWVQDDGTTRPAAELDALARGIALDASRADRFARAIESATAHVPLLSPAAASLVVAGAPEPLPTEALVARTFRLSNAGQAALTPDEARETIVLLATAVATVPLRERPGVVAYVERLRLDADPAEGDAQAALLLKAALLQLTSPQLARLQELHERAIRAGAART